MSKDWRNDTVVLTPTRKPDYAEPANGGALWYHENTSLIYTGVDGTSSSFQAGQPPPKLAVNTFKPDGTGSGTWAQLIRPTDPKFNRLHKPTYASTTSGMNVGLSLNGGNATTLSPGLVTFDMVSKDFRNETATAAGPVFWRGQMHYVPVYGARGFMISLGGTSGGVDGLKGFSNLAIYNPFTGKWASQNTTGNAPSGRVDHCVAGAPSAAGTWEVFVYGGYNGNLGSASVAFDTIHILTLPAFHWIQVPYNPSSPRYGMTCHGVGGSQILVIGGADPNPSKTDGDPQDINKSKLESADPNKQGLSVFDLTTLTWKDSYSSKPPAYTWSTPLKEYYDQAGGIKAQISKLNGPIEELVGGSDFTRVPPGLSKLFASHTSDSSPSPSRAPKKSSNVGAIAGGTVGGVAALALIGVLVFFLLRRRKSQKQTQAYNHVDVNSLDDMYKSHSANDPPPTYVYKDGQWRPKPGVVEADAVEAERSDLFEAEGLAIKGRRRTDKQTPSELP